MAQKQNQNQRSNAPAHLIRDGALSVSIWRREHEKNVFYSVTASRAYTEDDGASWKYSDSFSSGEILTVCELMRTAYQWIRRAQAEEKQ